MNNFYYFNPTKIIFGKGMLSRIGKEIQPYKKIFFLYGQGSIKTNGIYQQVVKALDESGVCYVEFGGIEPNPDYHTAMKATKFAQKTGVDFILAVGGGSVIDAGKFISIAYNARNMDLWEMITSNAVPPPTNALPIGCVGTVPGTGSEMNNSLVLSRRELRQKVAYSHILLYPKFSILDPEFTFSLTQYQTALGLVDTYMHVLEQYITYPVFSLLQDRQAEAILKTLIEISKPLLDQPLNYDFRSTMMWCSAQALNGTISRGNPTDWATHEIGHILTAIYGIPHAQTLSLIIGGVYRHMFEYKKEKLLQYGHRVWQLKGTDVFVALKSIEMTEKFFEGLGLKTSFSSLGLSATDVVKSVREYLQKTDFKNIGERKNIDIESVCTILYSIE